MNNSFQATSGSFTHTFDDRCAIEKKLYQSVGPFEYRMDSDPFENCDKCTYDENSFYRPFDDKIVDTESELKGITRAQTRCPQFKYSPTCEKSGTCTNTFDNSVPIVMAQEVCPIIFNNLVRPTGSGYVSNTEPSCKRRVPRNPQ
jgi:hypothetical protein